MKTKSSTKKPAVVLAVVAVALVLVVTSVVVGIVAAKRSRPETFSLAETITLRDGEPLRLVAHRGFSGIEPENTLEALQAAGEAGFYACEFDIHATADGRWVLMHDSDIARTSNGEGLVGDMTYEQLSQFSIDSGNGIDKYTQGSVVIPTLEQALDVLAQYDTIPEIEVKTATDAALDTLVDILTARGILQEVIVIDFSLEHLQYLRSINTELTLLHLTGTLNDKEIENCVASGMDGIAFEGNANKNLSYIAKALDENLILSSWTIDNPQRAQLLYDCGIPYITTNRIHP